MQLPAITGRNSYHLQISLHILGVIREFITSLRALVFLMSQDFVKKPPSLLLLCLHLFNTAHLLAISCFQFG